MQTLQIRLTKELIKKAQTLVEKGLYSNKSEAIRDSLRRLSFSQELGLEKRCFKILFTSDLHGNLMQYTKLFEKALVEKADAIIIGGDLAPKDKDHRTINDQKIFFENKFFPLIKKINKEFERKNQKCPIFLILGNDDFRTNYKLLKDNERSVGFELIQNKCIVLHEDYKICGYSYVPLTPYVFKDWEKLDLVREPETNYRTGYLISGTRAWKDKQVEKEFVLSERTDTIENDLKTLCKSTSPEKLVLVTHSPPYNTDLDIEKHGLHVGSAAIKKFIEEEKPFVTLHGHIHEAVEKSGMFKQVIGKSISMTSGNDHVGKLLSIVKFNLFEPEHAVREII